MSKVNDNTVVEVDKHFCWVRTGILNQLAFGLLILCSGGLFVILCVNYPGIQMIILTSRCKPEDAQYCCITKADGSKTYAKVKHSTIQEGVFAVFEDMGHRYFSSPEKSWRIDAVPFEPERFTERFVTKADPARPSRKFLMTMYGLNRMEIEAADWLTITLKEVLSPFYLFQYFAVAVWLYTDYVIYSVIVMFITLMSIAFCVKQKLFNLRRLHDLAGSQHAVIPFNNDTQTRGATTIADCALVPGDCFVVTSGMSIAADSVLIRGRIVVDESMLTGESVPVTKSEYVYSEVESVATKRVANLLYSGTTVKMVAPGDEAVAMVYRTGFRSARGELIAALIQPQAEIVQFMPDAMLAILFMVIITTAIFGWSADQLKKLDTVDGDVVIAYLTALTIAVPPGLVACLSIGTSLSVTRLALQNITITDTAKLNAAGYVTAACFDKTGTLTDENIVFQGVQLFDDTNHALLRKSASVGTSATDLLGASSPFSRQIVYEIMAACHSLSMLTHDPVHAEAQEDGDDIESRNTLGSIVGDPLEVELFKVSGWALGSTADHRHTTATPPDSQPHSGNPHVIHKQFEFTPVKLRAGTLMERPNGEKMLLVKGSPEMLTKLVDKDSLPATLDQELATLTKQGFRVLAMAYRPCSEPLETLMAMSQENLEKGLRFLGLLYFSNKLKKDTFPATIQNLLDAKVAVNMITGDHFHTAAAIAYDCSILSRAAPVYLIDGVHNGIKLVPTIIDVATEKPIENMSLEGLVDSFYSNTAVAVMDSNATLPSNQIQLVFTGVGFQAVQSSCPELLEPLCRITRVFARMKPADKRKVVEALMAPDSHAHLREDFSASLRNYSVIDYFTYSAVDQRNGNGKSCHVLFCGDGANDMEALSTATVGVSLCDTATTVAAAIVSTNQSPLAVVDVLREGRCSLVTAYVLVNFNIMYAIIQLFMTCYLNNVGLVFGDYMYLIQDMFFSLFLGLAIANAGPSDTLSTRLPPHSLFSPGLLVKLLVQLGIFPIFQYALLQILYAQKWFDKFETDDPLTESYANEGAALNILALAQLMIASVVVTIGEPFRKPWYTSKAHITILLLHTSWIMYLLFGEDNEFMVGVDNKLAPHSFSGIIIGMIAANVVVSAIATKLADLVF